MAAPNFRPSVSCAQLSCVLYGLGAALGSVLWARPQFPETIISAPAATPIINVSLIACVMVVLPCGFDIPGASRPGCRTPGRSVACLAFGCLALKCASRPLADRSQSPHATRIITGRAETGKPSSAVDFAHRNSDASHLR